MMHSKAITKRRREPAYYDGETIEILKHVLEDTWDALTSYERSVSNRSALAIHILDAASSGERDPRILKARALMEFRKREGAKAPIHANILP